MACGGRRGVEIDVTGLAFFLLLLFSFILNYERSHYFFKGP